MRVLITGSSGQIGTNLALRLQQDGHWVFGVDKRTNTWTQAFDTLLQDLAIQYPAFRGGIAGVLAGLGASALGWALANWVFKMAYVPSATPLLAAMLLGAVGVVAGGWVGTRALLSRPPLASLRALT